MSRSGARHERAWRRGGQCAGLLVFALAIPIHAERDLATDRPDSTESPYTVEPGRVQVEASFLSVEHDRHTPARDGSRLTAWNVLPVNVRIGLTPDWEMQLIADNFIEVETEVPSAGLRERVRGFGDVTLRFKRNLWGNDGGPTALGLMPFLKLPTGSDAVSNGEVEGGLIVAFAADLGAGWGFGAMTEVDFARNDADDADDTVWLNTATVSRGLTERLGFFLELALETGAEKPALCFNCGFTFAVDEDLQLDCGVNLGLTRAAADRVVFAGIAKRF